MSEMPTRPPVVAVAAALLLCSAIVLLATWGLRIDAVASNGARVFFVVVWSYLAWSAFSGGGWVRAAVLAIFAITAWGTLNAPSWAESIAGVPPGEAAAKVLAALALLAMCTPPAHRYFAAARALRNQAQ